MRSLNTPTQVQEARDKIVGAIAGLSLHDAEWALDEAKGLLFRAQDSALQDAKFNPSAVKAPQWSDV